MDTFERTFLADNVPDDLPILSKELITQFFLRNQESVIRFKQSLRDDKCAYIATIKKRTGFAEEDIDILIPPEIYYRVLNRLSDTNKKPVIKARYKAIINDHEASLDVYPNSSKKLIKIKFSSMKEAQFFTPPLWLHEIKSNKSEQILPILQCV